MIAPDSTHLASSETAAFRRPFPSGRSSSQMTQSDIYIKGANAVDPAGNVAVLFGIPPAAGERSAG